MRMDVRFYRLLMTKSINFLERLRCRDRHGLGRYQAKLIVILEARQYRCA